MNYGRKLYCSVGLLLFVGLAVTHGYAQNELMPQQYRTDQFISLNDAVPFNTALEILNQFAKRYEGKIIVDPLRRSDPINVVIDNMYWKKAFEYILSAHGLKYKAFDQYYEIQSEDETEGSTAVTSNEITPQTREVRIEAVFFEANRGKLDEVGIDWGTFKSDGTVEVNFRTATNLTESAVKGAYKWTNKVWNATALMGLMEASSRGEVLARPQIKVVDGQQGKVKVGRNFYLTTRDFAGNTQYREYEAGTILTVVPNIISKDDTTFIHLDIKAERSQVSPDNTGVTKAITESNTQTLLLNGEQTIIAGLYSNEQVKTRKGLPILKNLPGWFFGLRYLFGYSNIQYTKKELVILIKAEIMPEISKRKVNTIKQKRYINSLYKKLK